MGVDGEGQNCGKISSEIFRNLRPYRLSNGQLFCTKIDPGGTGFPLNFRFLGSQLLKKNDVIYYGFKYIFLNEQTF